MSVTIEQINPDGTSQAVDSLSHSVTDAHGVITIPWQTPDHTAEPEQAPSDAGQRPYYYRAKASCDEVESEWSTLIQINNHLLVDLEQATGQAFEDGTLVNLSAADLSTQQSETREGKVRFRNVASGAFRIQYKTHNGGQRS